MNKENVRFPWWTGLRGAPLIANCATNGAPAVPAWVVLAQFPRVWETELMAKRSLRILKRVSNIPSRGICESCHALFSADPRQLGQAGVQHQFNAHKCDATQNPAPIAKETAKVAGK
jgi:hypothetical protein